MFWKTMNSEKKTSVNPSATEKLDNTDNEEMEENEKLEEGDRTLRQQTVPRDDSANTSDNSYESLDEDIKPPSDHIEEIKETSVNPSATENLDNTDIEEMEEGEIESSDDYLEEGEIEGSDNDLEED